MIDNFELVDIIKVQLKVKILKNRLKIFKLKGNMLELSQKEDKTKYMNN